jgi:hypothetical protein
MPESARVLCGGLTIAGRLAAWSAFAGGALLAGAGLGFLARDLLGLGQPAVALVWLAGFALGVRSAIGRGSRPR